MKCFDFVPHDFSNVTCGLKKIAVLSAFSMFFYLAPQFSTINSNCFDTFASVWLTATARNHSALCRTKKAPNFRAHLLFWTPPRFAESWFEVHYYDHTIPKDFIFRKQLRMHLVTFSRFLLAFPKSIAVHQIP